MSPTNDKIDDNNTSQFDLKKRWLSYVTKQANRTAADPNAKVKLLGMVAVLLIICYNIPGADATGITCAPCVTWAGQVCTGAVAVGGAFASLPGCPPPLSLGLLGVGAGGCLVATTGCAIVCAAV